VSRGLAEGSVCILRGARKCFISILTSYPYTPTVILISGGTLLSHGRYIRNIRRPDSRVSDVSSPVCPSSSPPSPGAKLSLLRIANSSPICDDLREGKLRFSRLKRRPSRLAVSITVSAPPSTWSELNQYPRQDANNVFSDM